MEIFRSKNQQVMILRNPSLSRDFLFIICSFLLFLFSASLLSQGVIGVVKDAVTKQPVGDASVSVMKGDSVLLILTVDSLGRFVYNASDAGRIQLQIKGLGHITNRSEDIFLDGYSTYRTEIFLERSPYELEGVTVISSSFLSPTYIQRITKDDLLTVAGNFDDPVRIAESHPGIILLNDQANHLSVRGQTPAFNSWYLEGLEIVNPNHTNNAGTFSDLPTQSGGGVNMFSAQALGSTDLYTGINPLSIGRSAGAVIDMHLHESTKPEFRAKAGLLGFEVGGGAAVGENGILDVNLRYSFTGLLTNFGVDFGGEKIGFYDGIISYRQQGTNYKLKIFGWAGRSTNEFDKIDVPDNRTRYKDFFNIDYGNNILGAGIRYESIFSHKTSLRAGAAYSMLNTDYSREGQFGPVPVSLLLNDKSKLFSSNIEISIQHTSHLHTNAGIDYTNRIFLTDLFSPFSDESILRPYVSTEFDLASVLKIEIGGELNNSFSTFSTGITPGYRAYLQWNTTDQSILYVGIRHAAGPRVKAYPRIESRELPLLIDKLELGWNLSLNRNFIELKSYLQEINNATILDLMNGIFHLADYSDPLTDKIVSIEMHEGKAQYYGVEGQWRYANDKGLKLTFNQSVFKSTREVSNEGLSSGRFNSQFASHFSISKEIIKKRKGKNRIWNFSLRGILQGGLWEPTIDEAQSKALESTVYSNPYKFPIHLPAYKRVDAGIYRTIANSKVRWRYSLDIQNLLGLANIAYHYYEPFLNRITTQDQLGVIPVFSVQASW